MCADLGLDSSTRLGSTSSGTGTTMYLPPEIISGMPATTRSDIYSLGVVLYQLLAGDFARPITTDWANDVADPLLRDDLRHCFAGNPRERFAGAVQLAKNLRALPERRMEQERREAEKAALERAAYRRGMMRTAAVATVIVAVISGLPGEPIKRPLGKCGQSFLFTGCEELNPELFTRDLSAAAVLKSLEKPPQQLAAARIFAERRPDLLLKKLRLDNPDCVLAPPKLIKLDHLNLARRHREIFEWLPRQSNRDAAR